MLTAIVAAFVLPLGTASAACPRTNTPHGTPGVMCDVNWTCVIIPDGNLTYYNLCKAYLEPNIDGPWGAETGQVAASVLGSCYTGGVGVCYRREGVYAGSAHPVSPGCTGAGFQSDQATVSVAGVGVTYDISESRI